MHSYIYQFRLLELSLRKTLSGKLLGNYKSSFHGKGLEFQEFRNREEWEDSSQIDWLISSREGRIVVRKMQEERNLSVLQIIDTGLLKSSSFLSAKKEVLEKVYFLTTFSALENSDRVATLFLDDSSPLYFPYTKKRGLFFQIFTLFQKNTFSQKSSQNLSHLRIKNNLIFYYTDSFQVDFDSLKVLSFTNDIVLVHVFHSFENTLQSASDNHFLFSSQGSETIVIDTKSEKKRAQYVDLRQQKIQAFQAQLRSLWVDYLALDESKDVLLEAIKFMKKRKEIHS